jgi:2-polyprenyl-3-methyl-5-hydroxy-6-metoxy-1,4-benzoquinol methylase
VTEPFYKRAAAESFAADDATGWFERVYAAAEAGEAIVPWDHHEPEPLLVSWAEARGLDGAGLRALVVGCGLGDDAEFLAGLGFSVVAFDISATAIEAARRRWPASSVAYERADLFAAPAEWVRGFEFVLEHATVQALPESIRPQAIRAITEFVGPGGTLLAILRARLDDEPARELPPFTLVRGELEAFGDNGLTVVRLDRADERHWVGEFTRR